MRDETGCETGKEQRALTEMEMKLADVRRELEEVKIEQDILKRRTVAQNGKKNKLSTVAQVAQIIIAVANIVLLSYTVPSINRTARIFIAEIRPLIDVTPIAVAQNLDGIHATTLLSVTNFSGFTAHRVAIDIRYGESSWIHEWIKAEDDAKKKGDASGVVKAWWYQSSPPLMIERLEPGETREIGDRKMLAAFMSGSLDLEDVVAKGKEGLSVAVRATWQNEKGHVFDTVHEYRLVGTTNSARGRSFTFIPKGIVSQKDVMRN